MNRNHTLHFLTICGFLQRAAETYSNLFNNWIVPICSSVILYWKVAVSPSTRFEVRLSDPFKYVLYMQHYINIKQWEVFL